MQPYQTTVRKICASLSFLMEHQQILPDLKEIVSELDVQKTSAEILDPKDIEYLRGAQDALTYLIGFLEQKGN